MAPPRVHHLLLGLAVAAASPAQSTAVALASAGDLAADGDHAGALTLLADLPAGELTPAELTGAADLLTAIGRQLRAARDLERSLQAHEAALRMVTARHGGALHADVAARTSDVAVALMQLGRLSAALPHCEAAARLQRELHGDADHADIARAENNLAFCLTGLDRFDAAAAHAETALAICRRLAGGRDDPGTAHCLDTLANCLMRSGRNDAALPQFEASLAMRRRLANGADHATVEQALNNLAVCLQGLGQFAAALALVDESLAMRARLQPGAASSELATRIHNRASCLNALGRSRDALPAFEAALAMRRRVLGDVDHPSIAGDVNSLGFCHDELGRPDRALPLHEEALAMRRRLAAGRDTRDLASSLNNLAGCLQSLGRHVEALPHYEAASAMLQRLVGEQPDPLLALHWNNHAFCLTELGRLDEALALQRRALAMQRQLHEGRDHPELAQALHNLAGLLGDHGDAEAARTLAEEALVMRRRLFGDADHPSVATSLQALAHGLRGAGQHEEALAAYASTVAMRRRLFGDADHPHLVGALVGQAACLVELARWQDALAPCREACERIERLREQSRADGTTRQALFDELKRTGPFDLLQVIHLQLGEVEQAFAAAERSRGRELLDLCEQQRFDPLDEALRRAALRGDTATADAIRSLQQELLAADAACDVALHGVTRPELPPGEPADRAAALQQLEFAHLARRDLLERRARLCGDVLPVGRIRSPAEIRAALRAGEALLEFTLAPPGCIAWLVTRDRIEPFVLPHALDTVRDLLPGLVQAMAHAGGADARGRDPTAEADPVPADRDSAALFAALVPPLLWARLRELDVVHLAAHRELHRLPFEALVTERRDGAPEYWLDRGPAVAYVPSGSALCWLRQRAEAAGDDATELDLLVVGDPAAAAPPVALPPGALVLAVDASGHAARSGLRPRDVVTAYDGQAVTDDRTLRDLCQRAAAAIEDGDRADTPIALTVWRQNESLALTVAPGPLGLEVARGAADAATETTPRVLRTGAIENLDRLPPLAGARAEAAAIAGLFTERELRADALFGAAATEPAVFDRAARAKYVHFACHGIAEEYAGQSFSMLMLARPTMVLPGDDGLLQLHELLGPWRGRLASCRLVVLSACRTNVGPTLLDEAPRALPIGLLFAGAASVVSSLWAVDDASTRELMVDGYRRMLAEGAKPLFAMRDARRSLRQKLRHPFHWAPFCYLGCAD